MTKKDFFQSPSVSDILGRDFVRDISKNLIDIIIETGENDACVVTRNLVPRKPWNPKKFMAYGPKVKFSDFLSNEGSGWDGPKSGYNNWSNGRDGIFLRTFSLYQNLEGMGIVKYCNDVGTGYKAELTQSDSNDRSDFLSVNVPSRRVGKVDYDIKFECIPRDFESGEDLKSMHVCGTKTHGMGHGVHRKTGLNVDAFCAHDFAAYMLLKDDPIKNKMDLNSTEASFLVVPNENVISFYDRLNSSCLICPPGDDKPRRLNVAEKEIFLFGYVGKFGFGDSFFFD